jgi:hypothetical protein
MTNLILLVAAIVFTVLGLGIGLSSFALLNDRAPAYRPGTLAQWFSPRRLKTFFDGNGYRRLITGGLLIGIGALSYLATLLVK